MLALFVTSRNHILNIHLHVNKRWIKHSVTTNNTNNANDNNVCFYSATHTAPRLMHLLRSTLCIDSPVLPIYDAVLRGSRSVCNAQYWSGWHQTEPSIFAYHVVWSVRPWCCFALGRQNCSFNKNNKLMITITYQLIGDRADIFSTFRPFVSLSVCLYVVCLGHAHRARP